MNESITSVGILHPGAMGVTVAASARNSGCDVYWVSEGRGERTRSRAEQAGLLDVGSLAELCRRCQLIVSVCPPEFAEYLVDQVVELNFRGTYLDANAVAPACKLRMAAKLVDQVVELNFRGTYLDANAVAPACKLRMAAKMEAAGIHFVDGGIIGLPPKANGETWLLLSGPQAAHIAPCFAKGPVEPDVIGAEIGKASAVKICYAAHNKGSIALATAMLATADHFGVLEEVRKQFNRRGSKLPQIEADIVRAIPKAWRWAPEMLEIAATFQAAGQPPGFHDAAGVLYSRVGEF
ncbi:MAG: DUF1932 domain-containing protein, partial [Acidobacteriota bacterium]